MKKELIINKAVLIRTIVLIVAILNQIASVVAQFGFNCPLWYLIASWVFTSVTVFINAWENNDWTKAATYGTAVLDALEDGKLTEDEVKDLLNKAK